MTVYLSDAVEGAAGNLTPTDWEIGFLEATFNAAQVAPYLPRNRVIMMDRNDDTITIITTSGTRPAETSEGGRKPTRKVVFTTVTLNCVELSNTVIATDLLLEDSVQDIEQGLFDGESAQFAGMLDEWMLGLGTPGTWGNDIVTAAVAAGHSFHGIAYADLGLLLSAMLAALEAHGNVNVMKRSTWHFFVKSTVWQYIRDARTTTGDQVFIPITVGDSVVYQFYGIPVHEVEATKWPSTWDIALGDMDKYLLGKRFGASRTEKSQDATVVDSDGTVHYLWQENKTAWKFWDRWAGKPWDNDGFAVASGVAYVGT